MLVSANHTPEKAQSISNRQDDDLVMTLIIISSYQTKNKFAHLNIN